MSGRMSERDSGRDSERKGGYIARLIARNEPTGVFEQRRTERTPALQPRDDVEARPVVDDPFEAVEEAADARDETDAPGETGFSRVPTAPRRPRENITPQTSPPYPTIDPADSLDDLPDDEAKATFVSPARPIETRRIEPPHDESKQAFTRRDAVDDDDDTTMMTAADQGEAPRRSDAREGDSQTMQPSRAQDEAETAAPMESPWTFAELLAPFLKQFQPPNAGEVDEDVPLVSPEHLGDEPSSAFDRMLPVIETDAPRITPMTEPDAPVVNIGDIVIEVTAPHTPNPAPRRSTTAPPAPPRLGVRSKRGFGLGQM